MTEENTLLICAKLQSSLDNKIIVRALRNGWDFGTPGTIITDENWKRKGRHLSIKRVTGCPWWNTPFPVGGDRRWQASMFIRLRVCTCYARASSSFPIPSIFLLVFQLNWDACPIEIATSRYYKIIRPMTHRCAQR